MAEHGGEPLDFGFQGGGHGFVEELGDESDFSTFLLGGVVGLGGDLMRLSGRSLSEGRCRVVRIDHFNGCASAGRVWRTRFRFGGVEHLFLG